MCVQRLYQAERIEDIFWFLTEVIAVIKMCQLRQALLVCHAKGFAQRLHIRFHLRSKFGLADTTDGWILVEHADVIEIVEFAEDAELREFGDTRDEGKLQIWV